MITYCPIPQKSIPGYRKVLILGLDGVRSDAMNENNSPFMFALSAQMGLFYRFSFSGIDYLQWTKLVEYSHWRSLCKHGLL